MANPTRQPRLIVEASLGAASIALAWLVLDAYLGILSFQIPLWPLDPDLGLANPIRDAGVVVLLGAVAAMLIGAALLRGAGRVRFALSGTWAVLIAVAMRVAVHPLAAQLRNRIVPPGPSIDALMTVVVLAALLCLVGSIIGYQAGHARRWLSEAGPTPPSVWPSPHQG